MTIATKQVYIPQRVQIRGIAANAGGFFWHLLQMVIAMEVGMGFYHLLLGTVLAGTGYAALTKQYPLFGYWMMVVPMALGMIALMRFHRSSWRYCGAMTVAMLAPVAALTVLVFCYLMPIHTLYWVGDPVMILAMAAYMLYRPHEHARGEHSHADHEHASISQAETTKHSAHGG